MRLHEKSTTSFEFFVRPIMKSATVLCYFSPSTKRKRKWQSQTAFQCARVAQDPHSIPNPFDDVEVARFVPTAKENVKSWTGNFATTRVFPRCAYLDRDPEIEDTCKVSTGKVKTNPQELITSGLNTCIFVVIKTRTQMIGWHASATCPLRPAQTLFRSVRKEDFVSGFIVPREDRIEGSLHLKPTCRTMRLLPCTDPTYSRT
ncbi:hypothetical protein FRACYDRAFT_241538 [Fragilariopsis cylindrus CCMP1102]|uniref:Uncharacterized protein n=1 Tax=Fragilariopsis cylindrus CCMP1102 TaxID=635003 RepID=A0A1E7F4X7_9STRA|nr:hypothetical protein FRACYDRAFT_241538 [Fragilariopsis cylindrus CCMP1102]|eukprot:OEU13207.1 hypothetical protein FRACYDRAFT_241538 [Fragilariopsis cylindrus CCMP1102]